MDIRNFFGAKPKAGNAVKEEKVMPKKRPKPVVLSSSSEDEEEKVKKVQEKKKPVKTSPAKKAAVKHALSDSDDDFSSKPAPKKSDKKKEVLKPIDPKDFFGNTNKPAKSDKDCKKKAPEGKKKRKVSDEEFHDDEGFTAVLKSIDDDKKVKPSPSKKPKKDEKSPPQRSTKIKESPKQITPSPTKTISSPSKPRPSKKGSPEKVKKSPPKVTKTEKKVVEEVTKAIAPIPKSEPTPSESLLWVDKYKPNTLKGIIGQQGDKSNMNKLITWLRNWPKNNLHNDGKRPPRPPPFASHSDNGAWAKAALLSGPPGVGKTTTSYLVAKELGLDVVEMNASDTRSKKALEPLLKGALTNLSLAKESKNRILLMDEVDGMAGNEDRGGMAELIQLIKSSKIPVICMCNDRNHQKIRSLANYCFDLRFQRPRAEQIRAAMMTICFKEKIKVEPAALMELIVGCNQDIRQVLHHLSMIKANSSGEKLGADQAKKEAEASKKTSIKIGPWDVVRKVFNANDHQGMSLTDKSDLFFHDYSLGPLFVQENYLLSAPDEANADKKKVMLLTSKAADSIAMGDLVEKTIRSQNAWSLLPTEAIFASVIPGEYMAGRLTGQAQFPSWLGKYSRQNKLDRQLQELQVHTRLSAGLSKSSLNFDFVQHLRNKILNPLVTDGADGVSKSIEAMKHYALLREDLDNLLEVTTWPDQNDPMKSIESKVKAAFTRAYNKEVVLPYAKVANVTKKARKDVESMDFGDDEDDLEDDNEEESTADNDAMIKKVVKKPSKKNEAKASPGKKTEAKGKGRGKKSK